MRRNGTDCNVQLPASNDNALIWLAKQRDCGHEGDAEINQVAVLPSHQIHHHHLLYIRVCIRRHLPRQVANAWYEEKSKLNIGGVPLCKTARLLQRESEKEAMDNHTHE